MIILEDSEHGKLFVVASRWTCKGDKYLFVSFEDYAEYVRLGIGVEVKASYPLFDFERVEK